MRPSLSASIPDISPVKYQQNSRQKHVIFINQESSAPRNLDPIIARKWKIESNLKSRRFLAKTSEEKLDISIELPSERVPPHSPLDQSPLDLYLHTMRVYNQKMEKITIPSIPIPENPFGSLYYMVELRNCYFSSERKPSTQDFKQHFEETYKVIKDSQKYQVV